MRLAYPATVKIVRVPCTGRIDVLYILKAFEEGADGVFVAGCREGECHYLTGNIRAKKRVAYVKAQLSQLGINPRRVEMYNLSAAMGARFVEIAQEMTDRVRALGPSPITTGSGREWHPEQKEGEES
jgi:F420-non-reducing hydrogenase iron-sulfur subunit